MGIDNFRTWLLTTGWNDPAQAVLLFVVIVIALSGWMGATHNVYTAVLGLLLYAVVGGALAYLGMLGILVSIVWFLGLIFLAWFSSSTMSHE